MKRKLLFLLLFLLFGLTLKLPLTQASFSTAYLRLTNQSANSALSGTVCAQTSSSATEAKVVVTFPNSFTVSANANNWSANTNNLPSGATAWPGIGSPSVSGKSVTFPSNNLSVGTLYCFNFTGAGSTTGVAGNNQNGTITTKNSANTTIDSTTYAVSIVTNSQIQVTATVPPQINDLPISIQSTTPSSQFPQNTILTYKINYGLLAASAFPLTIQAKWSQGTIEGSQTPSVDILNYVIGSTSTAYGSAAGVVNTVNNTITWTIPSFPGNTVNKTVTFSLTTNSAYTGSSNVSFNVTAIAVSNSTVTPDQTVSQNYLYNPSSLAPTPTPTPAPKSNTTQTTATTTPTPILTPTPVPQQPTKFNGVSVYSVSQSGASIVVSTNNKSTLTVNYGFSPDALSQKVISLTPQTQATIDIPNLKPDTDYYFIVATQDNVKSDIFTFRTAAVSSAPTANPITFVATSNNSLLTNNNSGQTGTNPTAPNTPPAIVVPVSSTFSIQFSLTKTTLIKSIQAFIVSKRVLGANTFTASNANPNYIDLVEIQPGTYTGKLLSQPAPGNYELYARIIDYNGNITTQKMADLNVVSKFTVITQGTNKPIENARVLLYLYNPQSKTYSVISPSILPVVNPSFSLTDGTVNVTLPQGTYRAVISAIGYKNQTVKFSITPETGYPMVYLEPSFNIISITQYYLSTLNDALISSQIFFQEQAKSSRLFDLSTIGAVIFLVIITTLSISARTHIAVLYLPYFLYFKLLLLFKKDKARIVFGQVVDEKTKIPISRAKVFLYPPSGNHVLVSLLTNKLGEFYYNNPKGLDYKITVMKEGYLSPELWHFENDKVRAIPTILKMNMQAEAHRPILEIILIYIEDFLGMLMEFLIIFGLFIQIYFIFTFGILKVAPSIVITVINLLLILTYLYKPAYLSE